MHSVNLYLDKPNSNIETNILLRIYINNKRFKISTGQRINPKYWNPEKQTVRATFQGYMTLNNLLETYKLKVQDIIRVALQKSQTINPTIIKNKFKSNFNFRSGENFIERYKEFIEFSKTIKAESTVKGYIYSLDRLIEFFNESDMDLSYENINLSFYNQFLMYHLKLIKKNNTIGNYFKSIRAFMDYSIQRGYSFNDDYLKFKIIKQEGDEIALSHEELRSIYNLDLSRHPELANSRDLFVILCLTGLRYSDLSNLQPEHIQDRFIILKPQKQERIAEKISDIIIPILPQVREKINKFPNGNIKTISGQVLNRNLKNIGLRSGFLEDTIKISFSGKNRIEEVIPKYDRIATHTGRRTFVTLSEEFGLRESFIKKIIGHKDRSNYRKYSKVQADTLYDEMLTCWSKF